MSLVSTAARGSSSSSSAYAPWFIEVLPVSWTNVQNTWVLGQDAGALLNQYISNGNGPVVNDAVSLPVVLSAGTWQLELWYIKNPNVGIATLAFDGVSVGTADGYNATQVNFAKSTITGITVATDGKKTFSLTVATKNASSSGFRFNFAYLVLTRTA